MTIAESLVPFAAKITGGELREYLAECRREAGVAGRPVHVSSFAVRYTFEDGSSCTIDTAGNPAAHATVTVIG